MRKPIVVGLLNNAIGIALMLLIGTIACRLAQVLYPPTPGYFVDTNARVQQAGFINIVLGFTHYLAFPAIVLIARRTRKMVSDKHSAVIHLLYIGLSVMLSDWHEYNWYQLAHAMPLPPLSERILHHLLWLFPCVLMYFAGTIKSKKNA